jgi:hypothetical protein
MSLIRWLFEVLSSRGEYMPEPDEAIVIAEVVAGNLNNKHWARWEQELQEDAR